MNYSTSYNTPALKKELAVYISGYSDGEGCFCVSFSKRPKNIKVGFEVKPSFAVGQNYDRREVLDLMKNHFNCGFIRRDWGDKTLKYEVRSLDNLLKVIIPHFAKFPMKSAKQKDFVFFSRICELMKSQKHLKTKGLRKIIHLAYKMNGSGKRRYSEKELLAQVKMKI